ncbi:MAG: OsmC family protein [Planctomycetaceae bacterium]|nr:OsmC family protein [Planctomycetaceae bacterium]
MRSIATVGRLAADVEGDIEEVDGVLRITTIRLHYRLSIPDGEEPVDRDAIDRALDRYADKCPAYQSIKGCIVCNWDLELT